MFGEKFEQNGVRSAPIQNDDALHTLFERIHRGLDLRDHTAGDDAAPDQALGLCNAHFSDNFAVRALYAGDIREKEQA